MLFASIVFAHLLAALLQSPFDPPASIDSMRFIKYLSDTLYIFLFCLLPIFCSVLIREHVFTLAISNALRYDGSNTRNPREVLCLLKKANNKILKNHIDHCVTGMKSRNSCMSAKAVLI